MGYIREDAVSPRNGDHAPEIVMTVESLHGNLEGLSGAVTRLEDRLEYICGPDRDEDMKAEGVATPEQSSLNTVLSELNDLTNRIHSRINRLERRIEI